MALNLPDIVCDLESCELAREGFLSWWKKHWINKMTGIASDEWDPSVVLEPSKETDSLEYQKKRAHNRKQYAKRIARAEAITPEPSKIVQEIDEKIAVLINWKRQAKTLTGGIMKEDLIEETSR